MLKLAHDNDQYLEFDDAWVITCDSRNHKLIQLLKDHGEYQFDEWQCQAMYDKGDHRFLELISDEDGWKPELEDMMVLDEQEKLRKLMAANDVVISDLRVSTVALGSLMRPHRSEGLLEVLDDIQHL